MKVAKYFLPIIGLLIFINAQSAFAAYMKYTYQTALMDALGERTLNHEGGNDGEFQFLRAQEQFKIELIIPEIDFRDLIDTYILFENPVTRVTATNLFSNITINSSQFYLEGGEYDGGIYLNWWLSLEIFDNSFPNGLTRRALIRADAGPLDTMDFYQDNLFYRRCSGHYPSQYCYETIYNSYVIFEGYMEAEDIEYPGGIYGLYGQRISVPEPFSPVLLLTGLAGIFFVRRVKFDI